MKDDSGAHAVLTEQGSSASQMTAAEIKDVIARLPGCDGQAADAVSAYTQVKMEDAPRVLTMSRYLDTSTKTQLAEFMVQYGRPFVPSERNVYAHPLARLLWEKQFEEVPFKKRLGKSSELGMFIR